MGYIIHFPLNSYLLRTSASEYKLVYSVSDYVLVLYVYSDRGNSLRCERFGLDNTVNRRAIRKFETLIRVSVEMGRTPCCSKVSLNRCPWTPEEDDLLAQYIQKHGEGGWRTLPRKAGLMRCGKSCRLRWMNYLRPDVKRGRIQPDEEDIILRLHRLLGNRWSLIAGRIPGRTDNEIKNFWNTHLRKKLISQGIDPRTHRPLSESELYSHDKSNVDSENKLSPGASPNHSSEKSPQTDVLPDNSNTESAFQPAQQQFSQEIIIGSELRQVSGKDSLNCVLNDAFNGTSNSIPPPFLYETQYCSNAANMNPIPIPYSTAILEMGLQDGDASQYLKWESMKNSHFVAPAMTDSSLQSIPCLSGAAINQNYSVGASPVNFEHSEMQQHQVLPENNHISSRLDDYNSDTFFYLLDSFMVDGGQLYDETNKDVVPFLLENRQQLSHTETANQQAYEMWSSMSQPSEYPSSYRLTNKGVLAGVLRSNMCGLAHIWNSFNIHS